MPLSDIENNGVEEKSLFLLSVKEAGQPEIMSMLREKGYINVIPMTNDLRKYLVNFEHYDIGTLVRELIL